MLVVVDDVPGLRRRVSKGIHFSIKVRGMSAEADGVSVDDFTFAVTYTTPYPDRFSHLRFSLSIHRKRR